MDYSEYAANMDLGQAFLEVLGRAAEEGLSFVAQELENWRSPRQLTSLGRAGDRSSGGSRSSEDSGGGSEAAMAALEEQFGLKFRASGSGEGSSTGSKRRARSDKADPHKLSMAEKVTEHSSLPQLAGLFLTFRSVSSTRIACWYCTPSTSCTPTPAIPSTWAWVSTEASRTTTAAAGALLQERGQARC